MSTEDEKTKELTEKYKGEKKPKEKKEKKFDEEEFLSLMRKRHKREVKSDKSNRDEAVKDQKFRRAGVDDQWDAQELTRRKNMLRPAIVLDQLSRPINQVTGEMLLNEAHALVVPATDDASLQVARAYKDLIHEIEYVSKASDIYGYAGDMIAGCAYGAWRILTRYCKDNPFEQEIYLERIRNPLLVYMDSSAKDKYYSDAGYGFVMEAITKDEWEEKFEGKDMPSAEKFKDMPGTNMELWFEDDKVWIGDYYVIEPENTTFVMTEDDDVVTEEDLEKNITKWTDEQEEILAKKMELYSKAQELIASMPPQTPQTALPPGQPPMPQQGEQPQASAPDMTSAPPAAPPAAPPPAQGQLPAPEPPIQLPPPPAMPPMPASLKIAKDKKGKERKREIEVPKVKHYVVSADQILEGPHDIPGQYVPIILIHGIDTNVEGKQEFYSLIRKPKQAQMLFNQVETNKAEIIDMIPKAPWIMTAEQMGQSVDEFAAANVENRGALLYEPHIVMSEDGQQSFLVPAPQRVNIGQVPVAIFQYADNIKSYIEDALGIARADTMNVASPERTGAANRGKRKASDVGTYHFINNLNGGIEHSARVIVSMIPEVYDTDRDVRTMADDEVQSFIPINTTAASAHEKISKNPQRYSGIDPKELEAHARQHPADEYNDLSKGRYDVHIKIGPPFSTAREEAADQKMTLAVQGQRMSALDKYFAVKSLDLADGGEYAEALKRQIPSWQLPPKEGEQRVDPPMNPQMKLVAAKIETEQAKLKQQELHMRLRMIEIAKEIQDKGDKAAKEEKELRKIVIDELQYVFVPQKGGGGQQA
jgi:hypothetical protein